MNDDDDGVVGGCAAEVVDGDILNEAVAHLAAGPASAHLSTDLNNDIMSENYWLREKLKEIQLDRDRLLCEVANLRLELDMGELKRLPEERYVFVCILNCIMLVQSTHTVLRIIIIGMRYIFFPIIPIRIWHSQKI